MGTLRIIILFIFVVLGCGCKVVGDYPVPPDREVHLRMPAEASWVEDIRIESAHEEGAAYIITVPEDGMLELRLCAPGGDLWNHSIRVGGGSTRLALSFRIWTGESLRKECMDPLLSDSEMARVEEAIPDLTDRAFCQFKIYMGSMDGRHSKTVTLKTPFEKFKPQLSLLKSNHRSTSSPVFFDGIHAGKAEAFMVLHLWAWTDYNATSLVIEIKDDEGLCVIEPDGKSIPLVDYSAPVWVWMARFMPDE